MQSLIRIEKPAHETIITVSLVIKRSERQIEIYPIAKLTPTYYLNFEGSEFGIDEIKLSLIDVEVDDFSCDDIDAFVYAQDFAKVKRNLLIGQLTNFTHAEFLRWVHVYVLEEIVDYPVA